MVKQILLALLLLVLLSFPTHCRKPHVINFRYPDLYPASFTWDKKSDHFLVASLRHPILLSVSDASVVSELHPPSLPPNSSFLALSLDPRLHRLLAVLRRPSALAAFHLPSLQPLFLAPLDAAAAAVAADYSGNAYVTDSANDVVYKVNEQGTAEILSRSQIFKSEGLDRPGLNGVVYITKGYLLVTQSNTGKLFKVNVDDGTARRVILNRELTAADGIAVRSDGVVLVVSKRKLYFIRSDDSWSEGVVFDEIALDEERHASAVAVGAEDRAYVLYGRADEGIMGNVERDVFSSIVEVASIEEGKEENVWIFVLLGLGLAYFLFWRFQMRQLVQNMNKKSD